MVDKASFPAFTMGHSQKSKLKPSFVPGPGAYDTVSYLHDHQRSYKQGSSKRFSQYGSISPGPGAYNSQANTHITNVFLLPRSKNDKLQNNPGPGSYNPDYRKTVKANTGYKIGISDRAGEDGATRTKLMPGPGSYDTAKSTVVHDHQAVRFGSQKRQTLNINKKTPGPGEYEQKTFNGIIPRNPTVAFGKSSRSISLLSLGPGPTNYNIKDKFTEDIEKKKGFSLRLGRNAIKNDQKSNSKSPGPGTYNSESLNQKKSMPSFSMSKNARLKIDNQKQILGKPSPTSYNFNYSTIEKIGGKFNNDKRKGLQSNNNAPGPGAYEPKNSYESLNFSIPKSNSTQKLRKPDLPGPGTYDPKMTYNSQNENIGVSKDKRRPFYDDRKQVPGPGQYDIEQKGSKGFTIGHEKRESFKLNKDIPGPGNYTIPSAISNLPGYSKVNKG